MRARGYAGLALAAIGGLHLLLGIAFASHLLAALRSGQVMDAISSTARPQVSLEFWFLIFGVPLLLLGQLAAWVERSLGRALPRFLAWEVLALGVVGAVLDPDSGFWLILAVGLYMILRRTPPAAEKAPHDAGRAA